jgi:hypothetical protein
MQAYALLLAATLNGGTVLALGLPVSAKVWAPSGKWYAQYL